MSLIKRRRFVAIAGLALAAAFPRPSQADGVKRGAPGAEIWIRTELYFGTNRDGGVVSDTDFDNFVDAEVTPLFPDGLTLLTGYGQFKNSAGIIIREKSHLLILLYPPQMHDANQKIENLRECYKKRFAQESVLRVDSMSRISF